MGRGLSEWSRGHGLQLALQMRNDADQQNSLGLYVGISMKCSIEIYDNETEISDMAVSKIYPNMSKKSIDLKSVVPVGTYFPLFGDSFSRRATLGTVPFMSTPYIPFPRLT